MTAEFWDTMAKRVTRDLQNAVLSDITIAIQRKKDEGILIDDIQMMEIINSLHQEYGN
jgi:hypothetical protein